MSNYHPLTNPILRLMPEHPTSQNNHAHLKVGICYFEGADLMSYSDYHHLDTDLYFKGLTISNQLDKAPRDFECSYGWRYEYYNIYSMSLNTCEPMHKTLKTINRRYEALEKKLGRPYTYGQYVARIANCLKIDKIARDSDYGHILMNIGDGIAYIDYLNKQLHEECMAVTVYHR
jgi:hypothetical protein